MTIFSPIRLTARMVLIIAAGLWLGSVLPATAAPEDEAKDQAVAEQVEALKKKIIRLNRDLFILEEDLLFPASTQFAVFVSVDAGEFLKLDAVKLKVDGRVVASYLYTERQVRALERGGMQRLYMGNLKTGSHEVTAFVEGIGPDNRAYKQAATLAFDKGTGTTALEIRVKDRSSDYQPEVTIVEWE
ncbi:MAG: AraC family transcriptional regulator [Gammaproteobacteria bacterium]|nr:MAG: AraC family transcriptional regulator [Gammaproteobacteria bacterium]